MPDLQISSLRGGLNNTDPPASLAEDMATVAENIDFSRSTLGGKRRGTSAISLTSATLASKVIWMFRHTPTADETAAQLWAISLNGTTLVVNYKDTAWHAVSLVSPDVISASALTNYQIEGQSLHGKLFLAMPTVDGGAVAVDRLHVYDGTTLRRVGLGTAVAPTSANTGAGTFSGIRYYRVRYTVQASGVTTRRSEPGTVLTVTPSGAGTGIIVTKPATIEDATHWELEASKDNVNFYRIATTIVATTTVTDSVAYATGYAVSGTLSDDSGDYTAPWSAKYLAGDEDRLLFAGSWVNAAYASRVGWTPVLGDPGVGNDERIPEDTDNFVDLDGYDGGEITDLAGPLNGYIYAFKRSAIYKLIRTGNRQQSYQAVQLTKSKGALPRSVVEGVDENGAPCLFFLDPKTGPHRIGANGIEECGGDIATTWGTVNLDATVVCHGIYYPNLRQVWYWLATSAATVPNLKIVGHVREMRRTEAGVRRGWVTHTGTSAAAYSSCLFSTNIDSNTTRSRDLKPFIGVGTASLIEMADTGTSGDNGTTYQARIRSKPFLLGGLLKKAGVLAAALMAEAASGVTAYVTLRRDYGLETKQTSALLTATASETRVVRPIDNAFISELFALEIEVGDIAATSASWALDAVALKLRGEESA